MEHDVLIEFQVNNLQEIKLENSSSSCWIDEIEGFIFGPFTSRFWSMRKSMNQKTDKELNQLSIHAWDCITLQIKNKNDVHIIIKNQ